MIKNDVSFTAVKQKEAKEKAAVAARLKGTKAAASEVRVQIFNGGAPAGSAQETLNWLQIEEGVPKSENAGNAPANAGEDDARVRARPGRPGTQAGRPSWVCPARR